MNKQFSWISEFWSTASGFFVAVYHSLLCRGTGIRALVRGMANVPTVTRSY